MYNPLCILLRIKGSGVDMSELGELDERLLQLLAKNSRTSVTELAKRLGVSRLTIQSHMDTLERRNVIEGYTIRWHQDYLDNQIEAHILIATDQKKLGSIVNALHAFPIIRSLSSISGEFDLVALLMASSTQELDSTMDQMSLIDGVQRTQTSVLLSKKFER